MQTDTEHSRYCTTCNNKPEHLCLACSSYVCLKCIETHNESCQQPDLHPAELAELVQLGEAGLARLKRGQTVTQAVAHLRSMLDGIRERAQAEVQAAVDAAHECIEQSKEGLLAKVEEAVLKLSQAIDDLDSRLISSKYSEAPEGNLELEFQLFTQPLSSILTTLEAEKWIEVSRNSEVFSRLQSFVSIQLASTLLCQRSSCPWVNRYALLLGNTTTMCDLATLEVFNVPFFVARSEAVASIQLPSGAFFYCGGNFCECFVIDSNYSEMKRAGYLPAARLSPGLAERGDQIYVFGGMDLETNQATRTIQIFSLRQQSGRVLGTEMVLERFLLSPCWCRGCIFLTGGRYAQGIEEFHPEQETIRFIPVTFSGTGPSVCFPRGEGEIVILSCFQYLFNVDTENLTTLSLKEGIFISHFQPQLFQGNYYFTVYEKDTMKYKLAYMNEDSLKLLITDVEFS